MKESEARGMNERIFYVVEYCDEIVKEEGTDNMKEFKTREDAERYREMLLEQDGYTKEDYEEACEEGEDWVWNYNVQEWKEVNVIAGTVLYEDVGNEGDITIRLKLANGEDLCVWVDAAHYWLLR